MREKEDHCPQCGNKDWDYDMRQCAVCHYAEYGSGVSRRNINGVTMNFGEAIEALKAGHKVARAGWNGKGMFLYYVPANSYPASGNKLGTMTGIFPDDMVPYGAYIAMKTAQDNVVPWLASQTDVLAEDWENVSPVAAAA